LNAEWAEKIFLMVFWAGKAKGIRNSGYRDKRPGTEGPSEWSTVE